MNWAILQGWFEGRVIPGAAHIILILVAAWFSLRLARITILRVEKLVEDEDAGTVSEVEQRAQTLGQILWNTIFVLVAVIAGTMIMRELGLDIGPIIAGMGLVGLAVGFGAQSLVKDVISGFFILLENQFAVGDSIRVGDTSGTVERMTLRATFVRDVNGAVHVVPNGEIRVLANLTKDWARAVVDVGVEYGADLDRVMAVLEQVGQGLSKDEAMSRVLLGEPSAVGPLEFDDSAITMRLMVKTQPGGQWRVGRELRRRIKVAFEREGIAMPAPQLDVHIRPDAGAESRPTASVDG